MWLHAQLCKRGLYLGFLYRRWNGVVVVASYFFWRMVLSIGLSFWRNPKVGLRAIKVIFIAKTLSCLYYLVCKEIDATFLNTHAVIPSKIVLYHQQCYASNYTTLISCAESIVHYKVELPKLLTYLVYKHDTILRWF